MGTHIAHFSIQSNPESAEVVNFWSSPIQIHLDWTGLWIQRIDPVHFILWLLPPFSRKMSEIETVEAEKMGWLDLPRGTSYPTFPYLCTSARAHRASVSQERFDRLCLILVCGLGVRAFHKPWVGWGISARAHVHPPPPYSYLRIRLTNFAKIWCVARDPIVTRFTKLGCGVTAHSHVRLQFRCLGNRSALILKPHQKQTYLFRARSFIAKHGVLLVGILLLSCFICPVRFQNQLSYQLWLVRILQLKMFSHGLHQNHLSFWSYRTVLRKIVRKHFLKCISSSKADHERPRVFHDLKTWTQTGRYANKWLLIVINMWENEVNNAIQRPLETALPSAPYIRPETDFENFQISWKPLILGTVSVWFHWFPCVLLERAMMSWMAALLFSSRSITTELPCLGGSCCVGRQQWSTEVGRLPGAAGRALAAGALGRRHRPQPGHLLHLDRHL